MAMLGMLETLGIADGRPFEPDVRIQKIIVDAAQVALTMAKTVDSHSRSPKERLYVARGKQKWIFGLDNPWFRTPDYLVIDERTRFTYKAIGTVDAMVLKVLEQGLAYIGA